MHGYGMSGDLLHMGFYLLTIVAWLYLWMVCVFSERVPFAWRLGTHALLILAVGVPSLGTLLVASAWLLFGLEYILWSLTIVGGAVPLLGVGIVRLERRLANQ